MVPLVACRLLRESRHTPTSTRLSGRKFLGIRVKTQAEWPNPKRTL